MEGHDSTHASGGHAAPTSASAPVSRDDWPAAAVDLPGLDLQRAQCIWGDHGAYVRNLRRFHADGLTLTDQLRAMPDPDRLAVVHTLVGSALALGLGDVAQDAAALERCLRAEGPPAACEPPVQRLTSSLDTALQSIGRYIPPG